MVKQFLLLVSSGNMVIRSFMFAVHGRAWQSWTGERDRQAAVPFASS